MKGKLTLIAPGVLVVVCVAMYLATTAASGWSKTPTDEVLTRWGGLYGPAVKAGEWWRLGSYALLHAGIGHLAFNMIALLAFALYLAKFQGQWRTVAALVFGVVTGGLAGLWSHPGELSVGVSGGVFALVGAVGAVLIRFYRSLSKHDRGSLTGLLVMVLGYNVMPLLLPQMRVDHAAHVGGLVGGLVLGLVLGRSPVEGKRRDLSGIAWLGAAAMCVAVAAGGAAIVQRIPHEAPLSEGPFVTPKARALQALGKLARQMASDGKVMDRARPIYNSAINNKIGYAAGARRIEAEVLATLAPPLDVDFAAAVQAVAAQEGQALEGAVRRLRQMRSDFCRGMVTVLKAAANGRRHDVKVIELDKNVTTAEDSFKKALKAAREAVKNPSAAADSRPAALTRPATSSPAPPAPG